MALAASAPGSAAPHEAAMDPRRLFAPFAAVVGGCAAAFWPDLMREGDTWWHLRAGDWVLANRAAPHVDPFSFTFAGRPWVAHEWLSEAIMAAAFRLGGWSGLTLPFALAFGATFAIVAKRLQRSMGDGAAALVLMIVAALLAPSLTARPHLLAMPLIAFWARGRRGARPRYGSRRP